jgi:hypothetical protein
MGRRSRPGLDSTSTQARARVPPGPPHNPGLGESIRPGAQLHRSGPVAQLHVDAELLKQPLRANEGWAL